MCPAAHSRRVVQEYNIPPWVKRTPDSNVSILLNIADCCHVERGVESGRWASSEESLNS